MSHITARRTIFILLLLTLLIPLSLIHVYGAVDADTVRQRVYNVYIKVLDVYEAGGNVSRPVQLINEAISTLEEYYNTNDATLLTAASSYLDEAESLLPMLRSEGEQLRFWNNVLTIGGVIGIVALGLFAYFILPKLFFRGWSRIRGEYKIRVRRSRSSRKSLILDEEVWAVILAVIVVGGVFAVSQAYLSGRVVEPFSELGLLGKNMKIGDYPRELVVGDNATFYVYVGNHMGRPMYYVVEVKLGDKSTNIDPAPLKPIFTYERILLHNETWIFRVDLPVETPGLNQRIIVELWIYNETIGDLQYHGRWTQLWINVTSV